MYTIAYSATILDKESWDFIMKVLRLGPHPGWSRAPKWGEPIFMGNFVFVEGDITWSVNDTSVLMRLCQVSYRVYTRNRTKLWTCGYRPEDEDIADGLFGPHEELDMVHP